MRWGIVRELARFALAMGRELPDLAAIILVENGIDGLAIMTERRRASANVG